MCHSFPPLAVACRIGSSNWASSSKGSNGGPCSLSVVGRKAFDELHLLEISYSAEKTEGLYDYAMRKHITPNVYSAFMAHQRVITSSNTLRGVWAHVGFEKGHFQELHKETTLLGFSSHVVVRTFFIFPLKLYLFLFSTVFALFSLKH
jgi:hypothetical protein